MGESEGEGPPIEYTPTWILAAVCALIIAISLAMERLLHYLGHVLMRKRKKPLFEALSKVKEELMLLGFISLLLTVFQSAISKLCMPKRLIKHMLPCKIREQVDDDNDDDEPPLNDASHFQNYFATTLSIGTRRLLSGASSQGSSPMEYCGAQGKAPLLSLSALHNLHIFIFVLAISHVTFCLLIVTFGGLKIREWKRWEDEITSDTEEVLENKITVVQEHDFIKDRFKGSGKRSKPVAWLSSFGKQFYRSVSKSDYVTLRLSFIETHCKGNPKFNFHKYMIRALEDDFKEVVGISWYLWTFVIGFLLLNVNGWHIYFWVAFIPFILLLAVGTKLEYVIIKLAHEVAEKHSATEGELVVKPTDAHFWFDNPRIVLTLIHFILFQNAFEIAFFFWIWVQFGWHSCLMGQVRYIIPRLLIGAFIQIFCSYSTLPLYAIVAQMGSTFNKAIFEDHVQASLIGWAKKTKKKKALKEATELAVRVDPSDRPFVSIEMESTVTSTDPTRGSDSEDAKRK